MNNAIAHSAISDYKERFVFVTTHPRGCLLPVSLRRPSSLSRPADGGVNS